MDNAQLPGSPLLRLPLEIRLMIYEYLLYPSARPSSDYSTAVGNLLPDYHTYHSPDTNADPFNLAVRRIDPYMAPHVNSTWRRRSTFYVRTGPFLTLTTPTTYRVLLSPYTAHLRHTIPSLLLLNHQIHTEAARVLYSAYTFSFHTSIESIVPFLSDLTPISRAAIRHISLTKKPLPYTSEFDRAEWSAACAYLARNTHLWDMSLNVVAGRPGADGWEVVAPMSASDFGMLRRLKGERGTFLPVGGVDLDWVEQLVAIKGLRDLKVKGFVENCPTPQSDTMAFWVAFSRSVECGFTEWLREVMLPTEA